MAGASTTNAGKASRRGGNNKKGVGGFTGADDPRRNNNGQRSAAQVAFSRSVRQMIVEVGEETAGKYQGRDINKIEAVIRKVYQKAMDGDGEARNFLIERVEGKVNQTFELLLSMIDYASLDESQLQRISAGENPLAVVFGIAGRGTG